MAKMEEERVARIVMNVFEGLGKFFSKLLKVLQVVVPLVALTIGYIVSTKAMVVATVIILLVGIAISVPVLYFWAKKVTKRSAHEERLAQYREKWGEDAKPQMRLDLHGVDKYDKERYRWDEEPAEEWEYSTLD